MATKLLAIATAAAVFAAGSAFAQTSQPERTQPKDKGAQTEMKDSQTSSGAAAKTGTAKSGAMKTEGTAGSPGTTGMKNDGASADSKKGVNTKASDQGNK